MNLLHFLDQIFAKIRLRLFKNKRIPGVSISREDMSQIFSSYAGAFDAFEDPKLSGELAWIVVLASIFVVLLEYDRLFPGQLFDNRLVKPHSVSLAFIYGPVEGTLEVLGTTSVTWIA